MRLTVHPILPELRGLYDVGDLEHLSKRLALFDRLEGVNLMSSWENAGTRVLFSRTGIRTTALYSMDRYWAYKRLMVDGPELLPLGDFSPMGRRQPDYLDALLEIDAEGMAAKDAQEIGIDLNDVQADFRLILVVVDQPQNGWTQRWLSDAAWRFGPEKVPQQTPERRWVTVQLWTQVPPTPAYLRSQLRGAVMRAVWRMKHGLPVTLADHLAQEGAALRFGGGLFAGEPLTLESDERSYTRQVLEPLLASDHWPTIFAALYGDEAAREVGFPPLGLSALAGLGLAAVED